MASFFSLSNLFLQFLLLFIISFSHTYGIQQPLCNDIDRSSLLQFKQSFVFDEIYCDPATDKTKLTSWKVAGDCCSWDGVYCDNQTGHVIGLDLSISCLFGSIDSSTPLFQLVHLKSLNLSYNSFNFSTIPDGIRNLSELKHLDLSVSDFSGHIPSEILELSNLVSLVLSGNPLMLQKPSLKDVVETLTNLKELELSDVIISSHVPHSLSSLTSLTSLLLKNCSLRGEFPPAIFLLPNLRTLSLRYNPDLTGCLPEFQAGSPLEILRLDDGNFSGQIPFSIGNLKSLSSFTAGGCGFGGTIPSSIGNLTTLIVLDLSDNYLSGNIPSSFRNLIGLTHLSLSHNNFMPGTLHWLGKLTNLEILRMLNTTSHGPIPSSLRNLTQLQELWLDYNQLTGQIPSWLSNCTHLASLFLGFNEFHGPIPEFIFRLPNLEDLSLHNNNLSGSLKFDSFLQSKYLSSLQLSGNYLSLIRGQYTNATLPKFQILGLAECNLTEFPSFLRGQNELHFLELGKNSIKGYVPNWISTLESVTYLRLAYNSLTGFEQPLSILSLPNLHLLDLNNNEFEGPLPIPPPSINTYSVAQNKFAGDISPLFCNFTSLLKFDLSSNKFRSTLPSCLGNFVSVLNLKNNSFSGEIPNKFTRACTLKVMDFGQNLFQSKVPESLANCSNLEILNLEKNQVNDVFPSWLGILPRLRVLSLRSNKFYGVIRQPSSKFEFRHLQIIDLSNNYFTGKLPLEYFWNWVAMKNVDDDSLTYMNTDTSFDVPNVLKWTSHYTYSIRIVNKGAERVFKILEFFVVVDLSSNKFEGEIPEIIGTLRELQSLNLSNNMLTGRIPSSLGNLSKLEALDLSVNNLSGEMPAQLAFLTFLAVFNVSHNSLNGPIPRGSQFNTFENNSFSANPALCGVPLSRRCADTGTLPRPPSEDVDEDGESWFQLNWEIMLIGFGSGLVIGVAYGCAMDIRKYEWLARRKFASWRRTRRN